VPCLEPRHEIRSLTRSFAEACERAVCAGFDPIWIHNHGGYLLDQFMSPLWNRRDDEYGGDLEGRLRFPLELIRAARERVGASVPIGCMAIDLKLAGARTRAEGLEICRRLEAAGIDVLRIDQAVPTRPSVVLPAYFPHGLWLEDVAAVERAVRIPVITSGNNFRREFAEKILADGIADFALMGRPLIADPELPNKARAGRIAEIRPCTKCNEGCIGGLLALRGVECQVKAAAGRERQYDGGPAAGENRDGGRKRPGGNGGCSRGRRVRPSRLALREGAGARRTPPCRAARFPFRSELGALIDYYRVTLRRLEIELCLEEEVTAETVAACKAQAVVVAVGPTPVVPSVPGVSGESVLRAADVANRGAIAEDLVVVVGGQQAGCDIALYLAQQRKRVTIVEAGPLALDMNPISPMALLPLLQELGVAVASLSIREFGAGGLIGTDADGRDRTIRADRIIIAPGVSPEGRARCEPRKRRRRALRGRGPRGITHAIREGFTAGCRI
jgi:hypothetical protein